MRRKDFGFTLVELMIVVSIVAILLLVALPAYENSRLKSARLAGKGVLLDVASRQEQFFVNNKSYTMALADLGLPASYYVDNQSDPVASSESSAVYIIQLTSTAGQWEGVTAAPVKSQTRDTRCGTLTLTRVGAKTASGPLGGDCW